MTAPSAVTRSPYEEELKRYTQNWPPLLTDEHMMNCAYQFRRATTSPMINETPCGVCAQLVPWTQVELWNVTDLKTKLNNFFTLLRTKPTHHRLLCTTYAHAPDFNGLVLEQAGIYTTVNPLSRTQCSACQENKECLR